MKLFVTADLGPDLAGQFPAGLDPAPHFTVLYVPKIAPDAVALALAAITGVIERAAAFDIELGDVGSFEHPDEVIAWVGLVEGEEMHPLRALRRDLLAALCAAGVGAKQTHPGYVPHATLGALPLGQHWTGPVPAGRQTITELRVTVDEQSGVVPIGAAASGAPTTIQAWSEARPQPADLARPFVAFTIGGIYDRITGQRRGNITRALIEELARVFESRRADDPVCLDWCHGSAEKSDPDQGGALGRIERVWIEGDQLWMQPVLTARGRQVVSAHQIGDGEAATSALYASPEIAVDPAGLKCRRTGEIYGWAQLLAVAATPRPAQVASVLTPLRLSESLHNPRADGALHDTAETSMDPKEVMARMRANGIDEDTIKAVVGEAYAPPAEGAGTEGEEGVGEPGGGQAGEGAGGEGGDDKPEGEKPKAEGGMFAERVAAAERRAQETQAANQRLERQVQQLFAERARERQAAVRARVQADYERAVAEGRCGLGEEQRFAFTELAAGAEAAKLTARAANPGISDDDLAKLPAVRTFNAMFSEVRFEHTDLGRTYGHGRRPDDPSDETAESAILKFGEEMGIDDFFEAQSLFAERFPKKLAQLYRKEGLLG